MGSILSHALMIVLLPAVFAVSVMRGGRSRWEWRSGLALALAVTGWAFVAGRWDMAGYYFRHVVALFTVWAAISGWRHMRQRGADVPRGRVRSFSVVLNMVLAVVFALQTVVGVAGYVPGGAAITLDFPLRAGLYYVGQGGSTVMVNYHTAHAPQAFALDIVRLNAFGYRASGVYPRELDKYAVFNEPLYSPCAGDIVASRDGLPDYAPPDRDADAPEGNFVAIDCHGAHVFIAHMKRGSVTVKTGDVVAAGEPLGRVGNSGNTTEPHLHVHAQRPVTLADGTTVWTGVPIRFNGRFLARNSVVRAP